VPSRAEPGHRQKSSKTTSRWNAVISEHQGSLARPCGQPQRHVLRHHDVLTVNSGAVHDRAERPTLTNRVQLLYSSPASPTASPLRQEASRAQAVAAYSLSSPDECGHECRGCGCMRFEEQVTRI